MAASHRPVNFHRPFPMTTAAPPRDASSAAPGWQRELADAIRDPAELADQRVVVLDTGDRAAQLAIDLTDHTGRVVLMTSGKEPSVSSAMRSALRLSDVKILAEAQPLELRGEGELERILVHDLNEDEEYELTADAFVVLK